MKLQKTLLVLMLLFSPVSYSAPYGIGDKVKALSLEDQHNKPGKIDNTTQLILFSRDKKGGEMLIEALSSVSGNFMTDRHIVYISDISGMPSFVSNYIVLPKLRKKAYPILLDREGEVSADFPDRKGVATLIYINSLIVKDIVYLDSVDKIRKNLQIDLKN